MLKFGNFIMALTVKEEAVGLVEDEHPQLTEVEIFLPPRDVVKDLSERRDQDMRTVVDLFCCREIA